MSFAERMKEKVVGKDAAVQTKAVIREEKKAEEKRAEARAEPEAPKREAPKAEVKKEAPKPEAKKEAPKAEPKKEEKKEAKPKVEEKFEERMLTVSLRDAWKAPRTRRVPAAISVLRREVGRHTKREAKISRELNRAVWERGIEKPPRSLKLKVRIGKEAATAYPVE